MEPKKSGNTLTIVLIVVLIVAIIAAVVCIIGFTTGWFGTQSNDAEPTATEAPETVATEAPVETNAPETVAPTGDGTEDAFQAVGTGDPTSPAAKAVYASQTAKPGDADMTAAVATFDGGTLTNSELNIYFWMEYFNFMNSYGEYAQYFGLDANTPLHLQASMGPVDETNEDLGYMSWEQYFLDSAVVNFRYYKGLELAAKAEGFEVPQKYLDDLDAMMNNLFTAAQEEGYEDAEEYLQMSFGTGVTVDDYKAYYSTFITSYAYYTEVLSPKCAVSDEDALSYYDAHEEDFASQGMTRTDKNDISVRHILLQPEKDLDSDGDGTMDASSDAAKAAAKAEAERIYALWQENPTEDNFAALAKEYTSDGNGEQGGLYEGVYPGQMVPTFNDWCFDDNRQVGDNGIVETDFGFHIMYFSGVGDTMSWLEAAKQEAAAEALDALSAEISDKYEILFDFTKVVICDVVSLNVAKMNDNG